MGEVSGQVARSWHRRRRDQRLGYSALGLGAGGFVLVLVGTLLVAEVVPDLLREDPPTQQVVPSSQLAPARTPQLGAPPGPSITAVEAALPALGSGNGGADQPPSTGAQPGAAAPDSGTGQPGQPGQPGDPGSPEPVPGGEGPVGSAVDPIVQTVASTADGATGGATGPVTGPVTSLVDGVTDTVDGLLDLRIK